MNFGMDYFGVLMSRIGGAGSVWSGYGTGSVRNGGRQQLSKGQAVAQTSYADTFMKMSKAERREAVEAVNRKNTGVSSSGRYGNSGNIRSTGNSNLYNKLYGSSARANASVLEGSIKAESAGKALNSDYIYNEKNTDELYNSVGNLVDGYNDIVSQAKNSTTTIIGTRATAMKNDAAGNKDALSEIGITYNSKNGTLSIDEKKFKAADKNKVKNLLGRDGSFGQRIRSDSTLIQSMAATAVRNSTTGAYVRNELYGNSSLNGLMNSYGLGSSYGIGSSNGLGSSYGLTGNYGLSSFLGNWLA